MHWLINYHNYTISFPTQLKHQAPGYLNSSKPFSFPTPTKLAFITLAIMDLNPNPTNTLSTVVLPISTPTNLDLQPNPNNLEGQIHNLATKMKEAVRLPGDENNLQSRRSS